MKLRKRRKLETTEKTKTRNYEKDENTKLRKRRQKHETTKNTTKTRNYEKDENT